MSNLSLFSGIMWLWPQICSFTLLFHIHTAYKYLKGSKPFGLIQNHKLITSIKHIEITYFKISKTGMTRYTRTWLLWQEINNNAMWNTIHWANDKPLFWPDKNGCYKTCNTGEAKEYVCWCETAEMSNS